MTPQEHLTHVHAETLKIVSGFGSMKLDTANPAKLDQIALVARTVAAACETLADRAEAFAGILLDQG